MTKYCVAITIDIYDHIDVEADSVEDAKIRVCQEYPSIYLSEYHIHRVTNLDTGEETDGS